MILGPKILLQLVRTKKLVENLSERELTSPEGAGFDLRLGEVYKIESVNMPANLTASITPRSTTYRSGLFLRTGNVPPGYCGGLIFGLKNEGPITVEIEMGARFVHIQFSEIGRAH